jgi:hypothetical protein
LDNSGGEVANDTIFVLNPTGTGGLSAAKLSPRPKGFENLVIGLLDNSKPNVGIFMDRLEELLREKFASVKIVKHRKLSLPVESRDREDPTLKVFDELVSQCQVVINGIGD